LRPSSSPPANVLSLSTSPGTRSSLLHQRPGTHRAQEPPPAPKEGGVAQAPPAPALRKRPTNQKKKKTCRRFRLVDGWANAAKR
jgi:hypothetical protein